VIQQESGKDDDLKQAMSDKEAKQRIQGEGEGSMVL
jgi:hypothetical protein